MNMAVLLFVIGYLAVGLLTLAVAARYIFDGSGFPDPLFITVFWPVAWVGALLCGACVILDEFCEFCRKGK
ncbi:MULTISPECIES: hypothetical protein [Pantoea]|uniref:Uncharacterized protein n=1 Tax=Candidatus Pantoea gossypiicola TaxID=2608008 RepID=A0AB34CN85_9GAMM|nr:MULTISPECIES: hypothetical protein [Pantoea]KAA5931522.1 hypothetical protein F3I59_05460 [Pantoea sp. VH_8]KAA5936657.1 hypothetical protein F3I58_05490 [Pantoea sp. VH_4]KAA5957773.1 hypothetical protein F3I53_16110 [Pantoea sp. VH_16]KAA5987927.1 hypothetical protein F3I49_05380 [Pantoea sp. M_4]KAA6104669.1 hypothetical protein F3I25_16340 [Pantoea sp. Bo_14]